MVGRRSSGLGPKDGPVPEERVTNVPRVEIILLLTKSLCISRGNYSDILMVCDSPCYVNRENAV